MDPLRDTHPIPVLAARQHGNVSLGQLRDHGLTDQMIKDRVAAGWYHRRHRGVFAIGHIPRTRESRFHAAVLAFNDAVLSYRSAGALWRLLHDFMLVEVTVPSTTGFASRDGIVVHRQPLPTEHRRTRNGIPVTSLVRTLLDLAAVLKLRQLQGAFEEAQVLHHLDPALLGAEVLSRPGHRGTGRLKFLLRDAVDPLGVRSILELRFLRLCAQHGIPRPLVNFAIGPWMPDFLWLDQRIVVETDGYAFHRTPAKLRTAALKDEYLRGRGFTVFRLAWADVTERPAETAARLRLALTTRTAA